MPKNNKEKNSELKLKKKKLLKLSQNRFIYLLNIIN